MSFASRCQIALLICLGPLFAQSSPPPTFREVISSTSCPNTTPVNNLRASFVLGDFDGDHKIDVAIQCLSGDVAVLLGRGDGTFKPPVLAPSVTINRDSVNQFHLFAADFNGDGKTDLAIAGTSGGANGSGYVLTVAILLSTGGGTFQAPAYAILPVDPGSFPVSRVALSCADLDGDGKADLIYSYTKPDLAPGGVTVAHAKSISTGAALFNPPVTIASNETFGPGEATYNVLAAADFNHDGVPDLLFAGSASIDLFLGKGGGLFGAAKPGLAGIIGSLLVADLDGDGNLDFVVFNTLVPGNGDGTFRAGRVISDSFRGPYTIADFNLDGRADLAQPSLGIAGVSMLLNQGGGTFQPIANPIAVQAQVYELAAADFDGDGKIDLAAFIHPSSDDSGASISILLNTTAPRLVNVSGASFRALAQLAPESLVAAFGSRLAVGSASATVTPLPTSLGGTTVSVKDSAGVSRLAPLFFVSSSQVNYEMPLGTAAGAATVTITAQDGTVSTASIQIGPVSPGVFQLNAGSLAAALTVSVAPDGTQTFGNVYQVDSKNNVVPLPIDFGPASNQLYVSLYGTGLRNAGKVTVTVGGLNVPVLSSGAQGVFAGLDQVNVGPLPRDLVGKGQVNIVLTADTQAANTVNVVFK